MKNDNILAQNLKKYRLRNNLMQKEVAEYLNIVNSTYSQYETGKSTPDIDTLLKLSKLYRVSVDELLGNGLDFEGTKQLITKKVGNVTLQFENTENMEEKIKIIQAVLEAMDDGKK